VSTPAEVARRLFSAYAAGDIETLRSTLDDDLVAYVTNADAGIDVVNGRTAYLARLPDLAATGGSLDVTQVVAVDAERFLAMVEIRAERNGMTLHNFAAFLGRTAGGQVHELWMVDARPAYSDAFWT
jgi:ketosteroid isomerase-like protein